MSDVDEVIEEISFEEKVKIAKEDLKKLYLNSDDERDWAMAWSGGKDSTVVVGLTVAMLRELEPSQRKRKIHAIMSDTVVENPILDSYMHDQVKKLNEYIEKENLPMTAQMVHRNTENSYFYLTLGRGYFLPMNNGQGRWCTDRLKIKPQNEALSEINPSFIFVTGWNEWIAQRFVQTSAHNSFIGKQWPIGTTYFVDEFLQEMS